MPIIRWDNKFDTGIEKVDAQHRKLIELINLAYDAIAKGREEETVLKLIDGMLSYAQEHFEYEEQVMQEREYDGLDAHREQHRKFWEEAERFRKNYPQNTEVLQIFTYLNKWLANHILHEDKKFA